MKQRKSSARRHASTAFAMLACTAWLCGIGAAQAQDATMPAGVAAPGAGIQATKQEVFHSGHGHFAIGKSTADFKLGECTIQHYANQAPGVAITLKTPTLSIEISDSSAGQSFTTQSAMVMTGKLPDFIQYRASRMKTNGKWFDDAQQPASGPIITLTGHTVHVKGRFHRTKIGDDDKQVTGTLDVTCGGKG